MNLKLTGLTALALSAALVSASCGSSDGNADLASAKQSLNRNEGDRALIHLKNALSANPNLGEARLLMGELLLARGDAAAAAVELAKAQSLGLTADRVLPPLAAARVAAGEPRLALELEGDAQGLTTPMSVASFQTTRAEALARLGQVERAQQALELALEQMPDHPPALRLRARALASGGQTNEAEAIVESLLIRDPRDADSLLLRAALLRAKGAAGEVKPVLNRVLEIQPKNVAAHAALIELAIDSREWPAAAEALVALQKAVPGRPESRYFGARLALERGDLQAASEHSLELLKMAPDHTGALQLAGVVAMQRGEVEQAEQFFGKLVALAPEDKQTRRLLARVMLNRGQPARALETLGPLGQSASSDAVALTIAGEAHLLSGDFRAADLALGRAVKLQPKQPRAEVMLAQSRLVAGDGKAFAQLEALANRTDSSEALLALVAAHLNRRSFDAALRATDSLLAKSPQDVGHRLLRARVLAAAGRNADARSTLDQLVAEQPRNVPAMLARVWLDVQEGKTEQARTRLASINAANPKDAEVALALVSLDERLRRPRGETAAVLAKAVTASPATARLRVRYIDFLIDSRDFGQALTVARDAAAALPTEPSVALALARAQLSAGDVQQAAKTYTEFTSRHPRALDAWLGLSAAQLAAGSLPAALQAAQRALALDPGHRAANRAVAASLVAAGRADEAIRLAQDLAKLDASAGQELLGDVELQRRRPREAAAAFKAALLKRPGDTGLGIRLHGALRDAGSAEEATQIERVWLRDRPQDADFMVHVAATLASAGRQDEAMALLEKALAAAPDHPPALNNLAWLRLAAGKPGALELSQRAVRLAENEPTFLDTYAQALAAEGRVARALEVQKLAVRMSPGQPSMRLALARLYVKNGDKSSARRELEDLKQLGAAFPSQSEVGALLAQL